MKKLFLIDGIGALLSFTTLIIIITFFQVHFGIPRLFLIIFSVIAFGLSLFALVNFRSKKHHQARVFITILLNIIYCMLSFFILVTFWNEIRLLGVIYMVLEKLVVLILVTYEIKYLLRAIESKR